MGYAGPVGQPPTVAIAVAVLNQPNGGEATGGQVAGPVASAMLAKALEVVNQEKVDLSGLLTPPASAAPPPGGPTTATTRRQG
jgi:hypothetical protein